VGPLQFEVVAFRLQDEYGVQCVFDPVAIYTARWIESADAGKLEEFRSRAHSTWPSITAAHWCTSRPRA